MVATATLPAKITYEEFLTLPNDGRRYELIDGELMMFAGPSFAHQVLSIWLSTLFFNAVIAKGLGWVVTAPVEVKFRGHNVVQPDLVVILRDRATILDEKRVLGAPSLILEILSASTRVYDLTTKAQLYAENGVPEYWIVDPFNETITVHELRDGHYIARTNHGVVTSRVVPDLTVDAATLFAAARDYPA